MQFIGLMFNAFEKVILKKANTGFLKNSLNCANNVTLLSLNQIIYFFYFDKLYMKNGNNDHEFKLKKLDTFFKKRSFCVRAEFY